VSHFYVYVHCTPNGDPFYVGKGSGRRAFAFSHRPIKWQNMVKKNDGITIKVLKYFEEENDAFEYEKYLIIKFRKNGYQLVNLSSGGKGPLDYYSSEESRRKKSEKLKGYKHKKVTCPVCHTVGGETAMKRWHFNNCSGPTKNFKSRAHIFGNRIYLGKFHTKEQADNYSDEFREFVLVEHADAKASRENLQVVI